MHVDPRLAQALTELIELIANDRIEPAAKLAAQLLREYPQHPELWRLNGVNALQRGRLEEARGALTRALELAPQSVEAWCNLGSVYAAERRFEDAERTLRRALALAPGHPSALNNLGSLLEARGQHAEAARCFADAVAARPDYARAWLNLAATKLSLKRAAEAEECVRNALRLAPNWSDAYHVLGDVLGALSLNEQAAEAYSQALAGNPNDPRLHFNRALALDEMGDWDAAARACERALALDHDFYAALSQLQFLRRRLCDWRDLDNGALRLKAGIAAGAPGISPFAFLSEDASPAEQLACARNYARHKCDELGASAAGLGFLRTRNAHDPIKVGFVSSGFGEHPTALLIVELLERLKHSDLRLAGFATNADDGGTLRRRLIGACHEFHDLSAFDFEEMARAIHGSGVDILIDLRGYGGGAVSEVFAMRPAAIQVNWLAYPGTSGAPFMDYLIADPFVVPPAQRRHYSEALAWMPNSFQPSDSTRRIGPPASRRECGLPEQGIVFASFNNSYKFSFRSFAKWTSILRSVPGSVLWLLAGKPGTATDANLRRHAQVAGIAPQRLIFMRKLPHAEYLTRYAHVDLFLDTHSYNAHTTASDALWAGCPVLTQPGETFAARVAGSLNSTLGLAELNVDSDKAYCAKAIALATRPEELALLRERVKRARGNSPLFDMKRFAHDFERLLRRMFDRWQRGEAPTDLAP